MDFAAHTRNGNYKINDRFKALYSRLVLLRALPTSIRLTSFHYIGQKSGGGLFKIPKGFQRRRPETSGEAEKLD